jgi:uncharacterized protein YcbX
VIGTVAALYRYPVKSMQGEQVQAIEVSQRGVSGDRAVALLDCETGQIASAHHPGKWAVLLHCSARWEHDAILVTLPDGDRMPVGAELEARISALCERSVRFIREAPQDAQYEFMLPDVPDAAPAAFTRYTLNLAGVASGTIGRLPVALQAPPRSLLDVAPVHLIATSSLRALTASGGDPDTRRFRPNIVIDNGENPAYAEGNWTGQKLQIAEATLDVTMPTPRCLVPTLRQAGVDRHRDTLVALARDNRLEYGPGKWACLGAYASVSGGGRISVGDPAEICRPARDQSGRGR